MTNALSKKLENVEHSVALHFFAYNFIFRHKTLRMPPYNLLIHSAPVAEEAGEYYHWHVEIIPKLTKVAGFEWATGFYLNPTSPEEAAEVIRDVRP